jgi:hypothetical protein
MRVCQCVPRGLMVGIVSIEQGEDRGRIKRDQRDPIPASPSLCCLGRRHYPPRPRRSNWDTATTL